MMTGTLITEENADFFLPAVGDWALMNSDVFLGVIDDESNTACGVLSAEDIGEHVLAIRWIYVDESMRRKGAGKELVSSLQELASEIGIEEVVCSCNEPEEIEGLTELLTSCSFAKEDTSSPVIAYKLEDIGALQEGSGRDMILPFGELEKDEFAEIEETIKNSDEYEERLSDMLFNHALYDLNRSLIAFDKKGDAVGILAVSLSDKDVRIEDFYVRGNHAEETGKSLLQSLVRRVSNSEYDRISVSFENREALFLLDQWTEGKGEKVGEIIQMSYYPEA